MSFFNRTLLALILSAGAYASADQSVKLAWDASVDPTVVGYSIYYGPAAGNYTNRLDAGSALTLTTPTLPDGLYYFAATAHNAVGGESDFGNVISTNLTTAVITNNPATNTPPPDGVAPSIVTQPKDASCAPGSTAQFVVTAAGTSPIYQWLRNGVPLANGGNISGATSPTLTISSVSSADDNNYRVTVSNAWGNTASIYVVLSLTNATVITNPPPPPITNSPPPATFIVSSPQSQTVYATSNLTLNVTVGGTTTNAYQWSKNGAPIAGATDSAYSVASALRADAGTYTVAVTGNGTVTSSPAIITVIDPFFTVQPASKNLVVGQSTTFTAAAIGTLPLHYQWYVIKSGATPAALSGKTNTTLTLSSVRKGDAGSYYCVADNGATAQTVNAVLGVYNKQSQLPASIAVSAMAVSAPIASGTYNGLFEPADNVSAGNAGSLANVVVSGNGTYSGKVLLAGGQYSLAGSFDASGSATQTVARSGKSSLSVVLHLDSIAKQLTGTVSCDAEGWSSPLRANAVFYSANNPNPTAARYSILFLDNQKVVAGQATVTNSINGVVTTSGKLADAMAFSCGAPISQFGEWPVHVELYQRAGLLQGWLTLSNGVPAGTLIWIKPGVFTNALNVAVNSPPMPPAP